MRSTLVGCVTLHAVIDENFTVTGFEPAVTQRASHYEACYVGKGISCAAAIRQCAPDLQIPDGWIPAFGLFFG